MKRKASSIVVGIVVLGCWIPSTAQVANNGISERIHLSPEGNPIQSTTAESTVEWECISKKLTSKCIVYHNDQWFTFSVPDPGKYFLNISNQVCKDLYGIQMIIIEGNPCDTENYIIKRCISKLPMDDLSVAMGMLKADQLYLLNIDGFLGDYCSFEIQLSKKPEGIPEKLNKAVDSLQVLMPDENEVTIKWYATDSVLSSIRSFDIYRKESNEKRFAFLANRSVQSNAAGAFINTYAHLDTLSKNGMYYYIVLAKGDTSSSVILHKTVSWSKEKPRPINHSISIPLTFSKPGPVDVLIMEPINDWIVKQYSAEFTFQQPTLQLSLYSFFTKGMHDIKIMVKNSKTREVNSFRYVVSEKGWELRQDK